MEIVELCKNFIIESSNDLTDRIINEAMAKLTS